MFHHVPHDAGGSFSVFSEFPHQSEKGSHSPVHKANCSREELFLLLRTERCFWGEWKVGVKLLHEALKHSCLTHGKMQNNQRINISYSVVVIILHQLPSLPPNDQLISGRDLILLWFDQ